MLCRTTAVALLAGFADGWRPVSIGSIDHPDLPARCHWADEADAGRCELVFEGLEAAWAVQVDALGYPAPLPDDDGLLDVYFTTEGTFGGAYVTGPYEDHDPTDGRMASHAFMALDPSILDTALASYVAHEFQHVVQFATDFVEPSYPVWEGTATAAERWTLPGVRQTRGGFADFQKDPQLGLLADSSATDDSWNLYEYGSALWIYDLDQALGTPDGEAARQLWAALVQPTWRNEPDVLDALAEITGDLDAYLAGFAVRRARIGTPHRPDWAADWEGAGYAVGALATLADKDLPEAVFAEGVWPTGAVYLTVADPLPSETYTLTVPDADAQDWLLVVIDGQDDDVSYDGRLDWTPSGDVLRFGAVYRGPEGWDADDALKTGAVELRLERTGAQFVDDEAAPPAARNGDAGCGCSAGGAGGTSAILLGISLLAATRRRED